MSPWTRVENIFRGERLNRNIDEELEAHIAETVERGRPVMRAPRIDPVEMLRAE
jgi:hypothetical protein